MATHHIDTEAPQTVLERLYAGTTDMIATLKQLEGEGVNYASKTMVDQLLHLSDELLADIRFLDTIIRNKHRR